MKLVEPTPADDLAQVEQELAERRADLARHLHNPPIDTEIGRRCYVDYTARILFSIDELERMIGRLTE